MIVRIGSADPQLALLAVEEFERFAVELVAGVDADAALRSAGAGYLVDESNAYLDAAVVVQLAGPAADPVWRARYQGMLDYAGSRHWLSEDGRYIKAHIETAASPS